MKTEKSIWLAPCDVVKDYPAYAFRFMRPCEGRTIKINNPDETYILACERHYKIGTSV